MAASDSTISPVLPLRVAYVTHALSPHRLALIESVARSLSELCVFLSQAEDKLHKFPLKRGSLQVVIQKSFNWEHPFRNVHGYTDVSHVHVPFDTYSQLKKYKPDIVVSTELGMRSVLAALYRKRHANVKLVLWATLSGRTEATRGKLRRMIRKWLMSYADAVFVNGNGGMTYIRELGYTGAMFVVPYAIDDQPFRTDAYEPVVGIYRLLYTGQLIPRKGLPAFCTVLSEWCSDHPSTRVIFKLVGEGSQRALIEKIKLPENLTIAVNDRVNQEALLAFHKEADVFAFPTLGDEWGVVANEALIAGRPILGSVYSQAVDELIVEGSNGWLWNPDDPGSLYQALNRVFTSSVEDLRTMSQNAKISVARISPSLVASMVIAGLDTVSQGRGTLA